MNPYLTDIGKVYFFTDGDYIKIGFTKETLKRRLERLATGNPKRMFILGYTKGTMDDEFALHALFNKDRVRYDGEWFYPSQELIDYINEVNEIENVFVMMDDDNKINLFNCCKTSD